MESLDICSRNTRYYVNGLQTSRRIEINLLLFTICTCSSASLSIRIHSITDHSVTLCDSSGKKCWNCNSNNRCIIVVILTKKKTLSLSHDSSGSFSVRKSFSGHHPFKMILMEFSYFLLIFLYYVNITFSSILFT